MKIVAADNQLSNKSIPILTQLIQRSDHSLHYLDIQQNWIDHLGLATLMKDCSHVSSKTLSPNECQDSFIHTCVCNDQIWGVKQYTHCLPRCKRGRLHPLTMIVTKNSIKRPDDLLRNVIAHWTKTASSMGADPHLLRWLPDWFVCSSYGKGCTDYECAAATARHCPPFHMIGLRSQRKGSEGDEPGSRHRRALSQSETSESVSQAGSSSSSRSRSSSYVSDSSSELSAEEKSSVNDEDQSGTSSESESAGRRRRVRSGGTMSWHSDGARMMMKFYLTSSALVYFYPHHLEETGATVGHWVSDGLSRVKLVAAGSAWLCGRFADKLAR